MFRRKFYIEFFYEHILHIDMVNEAIKELIANNGGNKKIIAERLGISPQFLGQLERGDRKKPSADLVQKIKQVYGVDILTNKQVYETDVSQETYKTIPVREDFWQEMRESNRYYREENSEMLQIIKGLIQSGILPKQA
jgi:transcriptional regulator with XRE-family HTH domain